MRRSLFLAYLKDTGLRIAYPKKISNAASPRPCTYILPLALHQYTYQNMSVCIYRHNGTIIDADHSLQ